jgi:hypothetical protein
MKHMATRIMITAAVLFTAAACSRAQDLKAEIPFPFQAAGAHMRPGTYSVKLTRTAGGQPVVRVRSLDERRGVLATPVATSRPPVPQPSQFALHFVCTDDSCELLQLKDSGSKVYQFATSRTGAQTRITTVLLQFDNRAE